jgi:penicillin amidase
MNRAVRVLLIILGVLVGLAVMLVIAFAAISRSPFPDASGEKIMEVPQECEEAAEQQNALCVALEGNGLRAPVHVYRDDQRHSPHLRRKPEDLFFAQGYVHAQDRMWQMEFWRHISQGRVSEIVGEPGIENDKFIRTSGWNRIAAANTAYYEQELPEAMGALNAYSDGVNAYHREQGRHRHQPANPGPGRRSVGIEPWQPSHSIGWGVVMGWDLGGNWE